MPPQKPTRKIKAVPTAPTKAKRRPKDPREIAFNQSFGERLLAARIARDKSQQEVADALNIGIHQYKKHEYGQTAFPPYLLSVLSTVLDRSIIWFITGH